MEELDRLFTELAGRLDSLRVAVDIKTSAAVFNGQTLVRTWDPMGRGPVDVHLHARALARQVQTLAEAYETQITGE
ncbi:hypothetical protein [Streptomyces sp. NPDC059928]|uniref:hypothetical protein n=1 Tax=unclassified Streptomyces TaxID=2593676 RepID=UPI00364E050D